jgi:alkylation response protein AidB-like acyl-CoA dehydrogenase
VEFALDEIQQDVADAARAFARGRLGPEAGSWDAACALPAEIWTELGELGLLSICVSEERGGAGFDALVLALVLEELGRASGAVAWGALLAAEAGVLLSAAEDAERLAAVMDGSLLAQRCAGAHEAGRLGLRGLPRGLRLAPEARKSERARTLRQLGAAAVLVGLGEAATAAALDYARERKQFGRALASFQAIQFKLADARTGLAAARLLTLRAAASGSPADASKALTFASSAAPDACSEALQIHGGYGYTTDFPVERQLRDATAIALLAAPRSQTRAATAEALLAS